MIIIGLLIGGVLKGQQLITNAQIAATVAQIKAIDAATTSFRDNYAGMAGDITGANTRLDQALVQTHDRQLSSASGDGKSITAAKLAALRFAACTLAHPSNHSQYWAQLAAAGLLTGQLIRRLGRAGTYSGEACTRPARSVAEVLTSDGTAV